MSSADNMVISAVTFNPAVDAKYTKPKLNKSGGKAVSILNAHTNKSLYLKTPLMLTWGASEFVDEKTGKRTYDLALQFPRDDYCSEATDNFLKGMVAFQNKIKADAIVNSKEWLNKPKMSPEVVDALFHPMLKYSKDPATGEPDMTKSPTIKVKIDFWDDKFNCEIFNTSGAMLFPRDDAPERSPIELIPKGINIAVVIQCGGLWFANGKFGVTWKLFQAVVQPKPSMRGKCLIDLPAAEDTVSPAKKCRREDEDEEYEETAYGSRGVQIVDDSDEEQEAAAPSAAPTTTTTSASTMEIDATPAQTSVEAAPVSANVVGANVVVPTFGAKKLVVKKAPTKN